MPETTPLPANTVQACVVPGVTENVSEWIKPCTPSRDWMDSVPQRYIYRCIPMVAANTMGWELINPVDAEIIWNGGDMNTDLSVKTQQPHRFAASSHFGCGIATWYLPFLFRTSPDLGLIVTGPANSERNDAIALDAFVRTDWLPFPFTMNWRLTRKDEPVIFKAGEAICRIFPYPIALLEETRFEIRELAEDTEFLAQVNEWGQRRQENVARQQADARKWQETGARPTGEGVWNGQYVRARGQVENKGFQPHQTVFKCPPPEDKRKA